MSSCQRFARLARFWWCLECFNLFFPFVFQFIREYTCKVDELVKDRIEALNEVKAKEKEEKDVI